MSLPTTTIELAIGALGFLLTLAARTATVNHVVRSRLRLSLVLFPLTMVLNLGLAAAGYVPGAAADPRTALDHLASITYLLIALASIHLVVTVLLNPLRADRISEHFPNIVQDAIIIGLFLVAATMIGSEKFLTTSAVGAVVIGFALQDTLGNLFAGLAIQVEKPFRAGHWISVGGYEGVVTAVTWRATKLRTKTGNMVTLPNNTVAKEAITNYSEPARPTRMQVDVGVSYQARPNFVKASILEAIAGLPLLSPTPAPDIIIEDFSSSSITYRVRFWITDFGTDGLARDQVRTAIYYMFQRRGIEIPYPIQVEYQRFESPESEAMRRLEALVLLLRGVDVLSPLADEEIRALAERSSQQIFGGGETIVREGAPGDSLFVIARGTVRVTVGTPAREVATIGAGGYFGEMSLLTGDARTATVSAAGDCEVVEITADSFRRIAAQHPLVVEQISLEVSARRRGLERAKQASAGAAVVTEAEPLSFLARVQRFLGLPTQKA